MTSHSLLLRLALKAAASIALTALLPLVPVTRDTARVTGLSLVQRHYLTLAEQGVAKAALWADPKRHWYGKTLRSAPGGPVTTIWGVVPLWETVSYIAMASPTKAHLATVNRFADHAERYWDPALMPAGAYTPQPSPHVRHTVAYFDDNAWWGLGFVNSYRATHRPRYLTDAQRASRFISGWGWDRRGGGLWWNTSHPWRSSEALAGATDLAARLYQITGQLTYLNWAVTLIDWANHHILKWDGSYSQHLPHNGTITHAGTGAMIDAFTALCQTRQPVPVGIYEGISLAGVRQGAYRFPQHPGSWCSWAESLAQKTAFGVQVGIHRFDSFQPLQEGPQDDAVYIRDLLNLYAQDHNPTWYRIASRTAQRIYTNTRTATGLYLKGWNGARRILDTQPGMLRTHAASISVFADLALASVPR